MTNNRKTAIDIYGKRHKLITQYAIPQYLKTDYIRCPSTLQVWVDDVLFVQLDIPDGKYCQGCDKSAEDCPGNRLLVSNILIINKLYGYPIKLCVWCKFWAMVRFQRYDIQNVPRVIREGLLAGHTAKNVVARL
jgi:hypothetical protein